MLNVDKNMLWCLLMEENKWIKERERERENQCTFSNAPHRKNNERISIKSCIFVRDYDENKENDGKSVGIIFYFIFPPASSVSVYIILINNTAILRQISKNLTIFHTKGIEIASCMGHTQTNHCVFFFESHSDEIFHWISKLVLLLLLLCFDIVESLYTTHCARRMDLDARIEQVHARLRSVFHSC